MRVYKSIVRYRGHQRTKPLRTTSPTYGLTAHPLRYPIPTWIQESESRPFNHTARIAKACFDNPVTRTTPVRITRNSLPPGPTYFTCPYHIGSTWHDLTTYSAQGDQSHHLASQSLGPTAVEPTSSLPRVGRRTASRPAFVKE